jgi:putative Mg2+ transporter-C (MgtC) family protein
MVDVLSRLAAAAALSGVIGVERQLAQKAAGLRTHMLVGLGAALFTLLGVEAFPGGDPARVSAQIVAGVGFLGAGAIFRHGVSIEGLTTAAGMWAAAAVGMAAGLAEYAAAGIGAAVALVVLYLVGLIRWLFRGRGGPATTLLTVRMDDPSAIGVAGDAVRGLVGAAGSVDVHEVGKERAVLLGTTHVETAEDLMTRIAVLPGVERVSRSRTE